MRPREKLLKYGPTALTIKELIAVVLITGSKNGSVATFAGRIEKVMGKLRLPTIESLKSIGLGQSKIAQILAALELGRRVSTEKVVKVTSPEVIFAQSQEIISKEKESLLCFYLNARGELLKRELVSVGALNKAQLTPGEIFGVIKELPVSSIILVHNHPSGVLEASDEDIVFTKRMQMAGEIVGVKLLDHLIITASGWKKIAL